MAKRLFSPLKRKEVFDIEEFSVNLLEKELELEKTYSRESIEDLITLYSEAIEHYNEESDPKFYDFQDRMHSLLMRPEVSSVINGKGLSNLYNFNKRKNFCSQQLIKSKVLESENNRKGPKTKTEDFVALTKKAEILQNMVRQEDNLKNRVVERREKKLISCNEGANVSTRGSYYVDEREQIEGIMERFYSKKAKDVEGITVFYLMKMETADEVSKAALMEEMKREILVVSEKHDKIRASEMSRLRKKCN